MWGRLVQLVKHPQWWLVKVILVMIVGLFLIKKTNSTNSSDISSYEPGGLHLFIHGMITNSPESKKEKIKKLDSVRIVVNEINLGKVQPELFSNKAGAFFIQLPFHKEFEISFLKNGWHSKRILIKTGMNERFVKQFHLFLDLNLFKKNTRNKDVETDYPTAKIYFDEEEERFISEIRMADNQYKRFNYNTKNNN